MSRLDEDFGFVNLFLRAGSGVQVKLRTRKVGRLERDLSTPVKAFFLEMYSEPSNI